MIQDPGTARIDIDEEVKGNLHRLQDIVYGLIADADACIVEADSIVADFDESLNRHKGEPQRICFEMKLEAQAIKESMDHGFQLQKFDNDQYESQISTLEKTTTAETKLMKQLEIKLEKLKQRIGYRTSKAIRAGGSTVSVQQQQTSIQRQS